MSNIKEIGSIVLEVKRLEKIVDDEDKDNDGGPWQEFTAYQPVS